MLPYTYSFLRTSTHTYRGSPPPPPCVTHICYFLSFRSKNENKTTKKERKACLYCRHFFANHKVPAVWCTRNWFVLQIRKSCRFWTFFLEKVNFIFLEWAALLLAVSSPYLGTYMPVTAFPLLLPPHVIPDTLSHQLFSSSSSFPYHLLPFVALLLSRYLWDSGSICLSIIAPDFYGEKNTLFRKKK